MAGRTPDTKDADAADKLDAADRPGVLGEMDAFGTPDVPDESDTPGEPVASMSPVICLTHNGNTNDMAAVANAASMFAANNPL